MQRQEFSKHFEKYTRILLVSHNAYADDYTLK